MNNRKRKAGLIDAVQHHSSSNPVIDGDDPRNFFFVRNSKLPRDTFKQHDHDGLLLFIVIVLGLMAVLFISSPLGK